MPWSLGFLNNLKKVRGNGRLQYIGSLPIWRYIANLFSGSTSSPIHITQFQTSSDIQANRTACFHAGKSSAVCNYKVGTFTNVLSIRKYEEKAEAPQSTNVTKKRLPEHAMHTVRPPTSCKMKTQKQGEISQPRFQEYGMTQKCKSKQRNKEWTEIPSTWYWHNVGEE